MGQLLAGLSATWTSPTSLQGRIHGVSRQGLPHRPARAVQLPRRSNCYAGSNALAWRAAIHSSLVGSTATRTRLAVDEIVAALAALASASSSTPRNARSRQMR